MKRYGALSALAELGLSDFVRSVWQGRVWARRALLRRQSSVSLQCVSPDSSSSRRNRPSCTCPPRPWCWTGSETGMAVEGLPRLPAAAAAEVSPREFPARRSTKPGPRRSRSLSPACSRRAAPRRRTSELLRRHRAPPHRQSSPSGSCRRAATSPTPSTCPAASTPKQASPGRHGSSAPRASRRGLPTGSAPSTSRPYRTPGEPRATRPPVGASEVAPSACFGRKHTPRSQSNCTVAPLGLS